MEEYRPLAADGAAPDGQTRLPWGDESPVVTVETPSPVAVEAHPPEPITHFATPEATFFTAEPPAAAPAEPVEHDAPVEHDDDIDGNGDADDVPHDDAADDVDADQPELDLEPAVAATDEDVDEWSEDAVDDVWSDDDAWAPPEPVAAAVEHEDTAPERITAQLQRVHVTAEPVAAAVEPLSVEEPAAETPPVAGDEIEATLDELLPSADDLAPLEELGETEPSPWAPPVEEPAPAPVVDDAQEPAEEPVVAEPVASEAFPPVEAVVDEPVVDEPVVAEAAAVIDEPAVEAPPREDSVVEEPVVAEAPAEPVVAETPVVPDEPVVAEGAPIEPAPPAEPPAAPVAEPPRMVSPSHPEWVEQERIVVDEAEPELIWADPDATDFDASVEADSPAPAVEEREPQPAAPVAAVAPPPPESPAPSPASAPEWFNPPEPEPDVEAPAAEWLTLPELDEQLAAVSDAPPPDEELPPMVAEEPASPVSAPAAPVAPPVEPTFAPAPPPDDDTIQLEPLAPAVAEAPIIPLPPRDPSPDAADLDEPLVLPGTAAAPTRTMGIRRIAVVAAALVMGTLVVRQLNPSAFSGSPTFVGTTPGQSSKSGASQADQPATSGSTGGSHQTAAGSKTSTTLANGRTATTAAGTNSSTVPGGSTATTTAGGKTTATTTGGATATTAAPKPAPAPASTPGYTTAKNACTNFNHAYVARDNGGMTDDQADDVFVNTASQVYPAYQVNAAKWGPMYNHALVLQKQLEGTVDSTDQQIEDQISAVYNDCRSAGLI